MIIEAKKLTKRFRRNTAVDKLDMHVKKGQVYGFIGRNGAGKTTTLSMLCSLKHPSSGKIDLFGKGSFESSRDKIGAFIQDSSFYDDLTAFENLKFFAKLKGSQDPGEESLSLLKRVKLLDKKAAKVKHLSHGMKKLLSLAHTLIGDPELIMLDEPTNGLDPEAIRLVKDIIASLDSTVLISSHDLSVIRAACSHIGIIDRGKMVLERKMPKASLEKIFLKSISVR